MKHENDLIDLFVKCKDVETKKKVLESIKNRLQQQNGEHILILYEYMDSNNN